MAHEAIFVKVAQGASRKTKVDDLLVKCKNSLVKTFESESRSFGIRNSFFITYFDTFDTIVML